MRIRPIEAHDLAVERHGLIEEVDARVMCGRGAGAEQRDDEGGEWARHAAVLQQGRGPRVGVTRLYLRKLLPSCESAGAPRGFRAPRPRAEASGGWHVSC